MKRFIVLLVLFIVSGIILQSQKVSNYTYKLDNGISVKTEQGWNQVWVTQSFSALQATDPTPVALSIRTLGDLTSGSSFRLISSGKEVKVQGAKAGTYTMKVAFKLSGKPGTISFDIENVEIRAGNKTTVSVTLYDYQVQIEEVAGTQKGLAGYNSKIDRYKGNAEQNPACGVPTFYAKGAHDKALTPDEAADAKTGKIKPGTYDIMITFGSQPRPQKVWLENFTMKADMSYNITTNLNAGVVEYAGGNKDVKAIHIYAAGTADRQKGTPAPDKNLELLKCEGIAVASPCPPGTYDILLNFNNGSKYEWRKNIAVTTGKRVQVK